MEEHPYGWLSLAPPVVAIALAIVTRRAVVSLLAGILCGALIMRGGDVWGAIYDTCEVHLWPSFADSDKLRIFSFTLLMGGMIGVVCRCGGMQGLINKIAPLAKTRRGGQMTTWLLGLVVFFDDYANTILLGSTLRPLCDRLKISREKLAYLVDSTAAPVAGLALLSTWVAIEIDYVREGLESLGPQVEMTAVDLFLGSIPYRFYVLLALLFIPMVALSGRDFGAMLRAERQRLRAETDDKLLDNPLETNLAAESTIANPRWINAVLPIVTTLATVLALLYATGIRAVEPPADGSLIALRDILGAANSSLALQYGALLGLAVAALLARIQRLLDGPAIASSLFQGARVVLPAILILWCATALSRMTGSKSVEGAASETPYVFQDHRLYTGEFLTKAIAEKEQPEKSDASMKIKLLPTGVFLLASVLSFATGTSFGTMGILLPMVVTLTYSLLEAEGVAIGATHPILLASVGSVLAGAIFGDHCSPISDTTILSSQACACDHIAHVVTQLPYAMTVATISILFGTLPLGWGVSVWWLLPVQLVALGLVLRFAGKKAEDF